LSRSCFTWCWALTLTLGGLSILPNPLRAGDDNVRVTVVVILATDQNKNVDPKLECIAKEVRNIDPKLTGFRLGPTSCKSLAVGAEYKFPLLEDLEAPVVVRHGADKDERVSLRIKPPKLGEITYTSACGKFFPIMTEYVTKDKERLIIAIMVRPCKGDKKRSSLARPAGVV
jgi:hypothetical protein